MRVLLAEDDTRLAAVLTQTLTEAGWDVESTGDGQEAYRRALTGGPAFDVLLLDWGLPGMDGVTVCRRLRALDVATPVLMLTARGEVHDRVAGLDAGADDYLAKPFDLDELLARVRALRRRSSLVHAAPVRVADLVLDPAARRVHRAGTEIAVSAREFDILHLLMAHAGQVVTRYTILDEVWDGETDVSSNVIDVYLSAIRTKIDRPFGTSTITTLRGVGYRIDLPPHETPAAGS